jgi:hypothetical protein
MRSSIAQRILNETPVSVTEFVKRYGETIMGQRLPQYSPKEKVTIAGTEMTFSHYVMQEGKQCAFFHYEIDGKQYGYIKHDLTQSI